MTVLPVIARATHLIGHGRLLEGAAGSAEALPAPRPGSAGARGGGFVPDVPGRPAVVWAVGDGADGGAAAQTLAEQIAAGHPDLVLYLGDVYPMGTAEAFASNYATTYGRLAEATAPTPGNHDAPVEEQGYEPYWEGVHGEPPPDFYSVRAAGWQILSLNSETDHGPGSTQLRWLQARLRDAGDCRIAFWHRPRFSAGMVHGDAADIRPLWRALAGRARIVVNGHEHDMQRLRPRGGITEFVTGAGGAELYPLDPADPRLAFGDDSGYGALRLRLTPGHASFAFVGLGGDVLDHGEIGCR